MEQLLLSSMACKIDKGMGRACKSNGTAPFVLDSGVSETPVPLQRRFISSHASSVYSSGTESQPSRSAFRNTDSNAASGA